MDDPRSNHEQTNPSNEVQANPSNVGSVEIGGDNRQKLSNESSSAAATYNDPPQNSLWQRWQEHPLPERLMAYFTFVIAFAAVVQVCVLISSSGQTEKLITAANTQAGAATSISSSAGEFTKSSNAMKDKLGEAVTDFKQAADQSAKASQTAADTAQRNIKNAQDSFRDDQRAWVGLQNFSLTSFESDKIVLSMTAVNSGKTPALSLYTGNKISVKAFRIVGPDPQMVVFDWSSGTAIPPQGKYDFEITVPVNILWYYSQIKEGKRFIYVLGDIKYDDAYGRNRSTKFCVTLDNPETKHLIFCGFHNDMN